MKCFVGSFHFEIEIANQAEIYFLIQRKLWSSFQFRVLILQYKSVLHVKNNYFSKETQYLLTCKLVTQFLLTCKLVLSVRSKPSMYRKLKIEVQNPKFHYNLHN